MIKHVLRQSHHVLLLHLQDTKTKAECHSVLCGSCCPKCESAVLPGPQRIYFDKHLPSAITSYLLERLGALDLLEYRRPYCCYALLVTASHVADAVVTPCVVPNMLTHPECLHKLSCLVCHPPLHS